MKTGVLIIHGFAGNVREVEPLRAYLEEKGYIVKVPRLKGHTSKPRDLWCVTYKDWIESGEESLNELLKVVDKVVVIGFSMGGLIATCLATKYNLAGIVTLSTPIFHWDIKQIISNVWNDLRHLQNTNIRRYFRSMRIPIRALINFKLLLIKTKPLVKGINCPMFIAQGLLDDTVQAKSAEYLYKNVETSMKEKKYYKNSGHIICLGEDKSQLFQDIDVFINNIICTN